MLRNRLIRSDNRQPSINPTILPAVDTDSCPYFGKGQEGWPVAADHALHETGGMVEVQCVPVQEYLRIPKNNSSKISNNSNNM